MSSIALLEYLLITAAIALSWGMVQGERPAEGRDDAAPGRSDAHGTGAPARGEARPSGGLESTLDRIFTGLSAGTPDGFLKGAQIAYELTVEAFISGQLAEHRYLLSLEVAGDFGDAIAERRRRGQTAELTFVGFRSTEIVGARIEGDRAALDVRFVTEIVTVVRDPEGRVVAGDPHRVVEASGLWTFERNLRSRAPGWIVVATESLD